MLYNLGATRSSLKADHLLQTPDTFIRTPLPGAHGVEFIVHTGTRLGANFTQTTAEFTSGGSLGSADPGLQRFIYVLEGTLNLNIHNPLQAEHTLGVGGYAVPRGSP
jgi:(S)-ureidoglycine aminohydrolase